MEMTIMDNALTTTAIEYATIDQQIKKLTERKDALRAEILASGVTEIITEQGKLSVSESYPKTFSRDLVEVLLAEHGIDPAEAQRCYTAAIKPVYRLTFKATIKVEA
jgi:hypothetical protein